MRAVAAVALAIFAARAASAEPAEEPPAELSDGELAALVGREVVVVEEKVRVTPGSARR